MATEQIESKSSLFSFSLRLSTFGVVRLKRLSLDGAGVISGVGLFLLPSGLPLSFGADGAVGGGAGCAISGCTWS